MSWIFLANEFYTNAIIMYAKRVISFLVWLFKTFLFTTDTSAYQFPITLPLRSIKLLCFGVCVCVCFFVFYNLYFRNIEACIKQKKKFCNNWFLSLNVEQDTFIFFPNFFFFFILFYIMNSIFVWRLRDYSFSTDA